MASSPPPQWLLHFPRREGQRSWPPSLLHTGSGMRETTVTLLLFQGGEWVRSWPPSHLPSGSGSGVKVTMTTFSLSARGERQRPWLPSLLPSPRGMGGWPGQHSTTSQVQGRNHSHFPFLLLEGEGHGTKAHLCHSQQGVREHSSKSQVQKGRDHVHLSTFILEWV